jgi:hypothetical protein
MTQRKDKPAAAPKKPRAETAPPGPPGPAPFDLDSVLEAPAAADRTREPEKPAAAQEPTPDAGTAEPPPPPPPPPRPVEVKPVAPVDPFRRPLGSGMYKRRKEGGAGKQSDGDRED